MLKIAIVGCGKIADSHAEQIRRIDSGRLVAVCDREPLMARQLADRFGIEGAFSDLNEMLDSVSPDVVHITTPPQTHLSIAKLCLDSGAHVYVEKPFTLNVDEARTLLATAERCGRCVTVGHDDQFSHAARRLRKSIESGMIGGNPLHLESIYCYDMASTSYAKALLGDKNHWVRSLPGGLLQNVISHGIARLAEWLPGAPTICATGRVSPALRALGETQIVDELRVVMTGDEGTTAFFTFSSQIRPSLHSFRVYGSQGSLELDEDQQTLIYRSGTRFKSHAERFIPPVQLAHQYHKNLFHNLWLFARRDFQFKSGMKHLMESFYDSILNDTAPPIPEGEIIRGTQIMDDIFHQLSAAQ
ncbi:MAG: Gfo/Idh/MocA family oxidoreductase [Verrucomicrobiae bacterium]|nr:Gfo/Idh/MocA family oxidoreductase [Verrucomicrobiae bacterium]